MEKIKKIFWAVVRFFLGYVRWEDRPLPVVPDYVEPSLAPEEVKPEPKISVGKFAKAIEHYEGFFPNSRSQRNNNPGNLKVTNLTRELGAIGGDPQGFCIFETYDDGFGALCRFIELARDNKLKNYRDCTVLSFFRTYAPSEDNNDPKKYAESVAFAIGAKVGDKLAEILT